MTWTHDDAEKAVSDALAQLTENGLVLAEAGTQSYRDRESSVRNALQALAAPSANTSRYVLDLFDKSVIYEEYAAGVEGACYQRAYALSADGRVELGDPVKVIRRTVYAPVSESAVDTDQHVDADVVNEAAPEPPYSDADLIVLREAGAIDLEGDPVELEEAAIRSDGSSSVKIMRPGWGSSGFYSAKVLERDGPKVFRKSTHMYVNHPTREDAKSRPERDLKDLAAVLMTDAVWRNDPKRGPGLYAEAQTFSHWRPFINEVAPHTGVSIRAVGTAKDGEAEGRKGKIIESLVGASSVDFVTAPGAGGKVLQLFESARTGVPSLLVDVEEVSVVDEKEIQDLREAKEKAETAAAQSATETSRLREALAIREAADIARGELTKVKLPDATKARIVESASSNPPMKDGELDRDAFTRQLAESVKFEADYIARVTGSGQVRDMGSTSNALAESADDSKDVAVSLEESFRDLGLGESGAKLAAVGR